MLSSIWCDCSSNSSDAVIAEYVPYRCACMSDIDISERCWYSPQGRAAGSLSVSKQMTHVGI